MKKLLAILLFSLAFTPIYIIRAQSGVDNPRILQMDLSATELAHFMAPGWNLGNTMEACNSNYLFTNKAGVGSETSWQGAKTTQQFISLLKEKGFNSVRIPCGWVAGHIVDKETMKIDEAWMNRVKEIIDYCLNANLYVVINDHWDGGWLEYDGFTDKANVSEKKEQLRLLWTNIANALKDYDERVLFAGLNEPGVGGASPQAVGSKLDSNGSAFANRLLEYEQVFIDAVRATGGKNANRVLVVQTPETNIDKAYSNTFDVSQLKDSAKDRLMVEVHFYDPYTFTLMKNDESWGKVALYWKGHGPSGNWDRTCNTIWYNNSNVDANKYLQDMMNKLKTKFVNKGYPVIIGEYAASRKDASLYAGDQEKHNESITYWYSQVTGLAMKAGVVPFVWDTNYRGYPHEAVFNRSSVTIDDSYIYQGLHEGSLEGITQFQNIYPRPSKTSTSVKEVSYLKENNTKKEPVYSLDGRLISMPIADITTLSLAAGIYLFGARKIVVK